MGLLNKFFGSPSKNAFAKIVLKRLRQAGVNGELEYDPDQFWIRNPDRTQFFLGNAYTQYCRASKDERESLLQACIATWIATGYDAPEEFEDAKCDLMPVVKTRSYFEVDLHRQAYPETAAAYPYEIVADSLCISLGYDLPTCMLSVTQERLDAWGVTLYEALEAGRQNLRETTKGYAQLGSAYVVSHGDAYDASRLVLTDLIEQMEVKGDPIAMIPNRETLLVAGSDDDEGLGTIIQLAEEGVAHERYITGVAVRLVDGDWEPWLPPEDHPLFSRFNQLRLETWLRDYAGQKELLIARFEKAATDVYVGEYSALQNNANGRAWSYAVWSQGVRTLLPRSDLVMFVRPQSDGGIDIVAQARWEDVLPAVGHLMEKQDMYPERYLVESFPNADELANMGVLQLS